MAEALTVDTLLAWGKDWERHLAAGAGAISYQVPIPVLVEYLRTANEALALLAHRPGRPRVGRPPDSGIGTQAAALIANGVSEDDAVRIIAEHVKKSIKAVRRALRRRRRG
jgi:hypothetical protein